MKKIKVVGVSILSLAAIVFISSYLLETNTKAATPIDNSSVQSNSSPISIKNKMLNAIDNYQRVKGSYKNITKNRNVTVDFDVEQGQSPYSHILLKNIDGSKKKEVVSDSNYLLETDEINRTFTKEKKVLNREKIETTRESKNSKGQREFKYRSDPATAQDAQLVTFPQQIAFWLNDDQKNYEIVGTENLLNRDTTVIQGYLNSTLSEKFGNSFKLWVDTNTGVLLKLITFDQKQQETSRIEVSDIEFDNVTPNAKSAVSEAKKTVGSFEQELHSKGFKDGASNN
ncbi:sigma-E factor regulatory protein RseB domain-containing protein [Paenibacillus sp. GCM10027628]|uniref:sigma-E factor regulatory protein RseB domain-containing protein n=1 Tax=Paenibacillus sp. GCM10027628 TaxID=3273413 RepID=UPI0036262337